MIIGIRVHYTLRTNAQSMAAAFRGCRGRWPYFTENHTTHGLQLFGCISQPLTLWDVYASCMTNTLFQNLTVSRATIYPL